MKRKIFAMAALAVTVTASAQYQFPNSTFEDDFVSAYTSRSYTEPQGWHGYATIKANAINSMGRSGEMLVATDDVPEGTGSQHSVCIISNAIFGVVANGVMTNGQIYTYSTTADDGTKNYNFSDITNTGNSSTYYDNNQFYTEFIGHPDSMKVWLKFVPVSGETDKARVSVYTHSAESIMYDPTDNVTDQSIIVAHAEDSIPASDGWVQYSIPFEYYDSPYEPGLILATFSTNKTPGGGTKGDSLYIDDIEMVYVSTLTSATYNGEDIAFTDGAAVIEGEYNASLLSYATGVGATVATEEPSADNNYTLTLTITGENISEDATNTHTYTIQFASPKLTGDVNGDGNITISDVAMLRAIINVTATDVNGTADVNGDGSIDATDVTALLKLLGVTEE